MKYREDLNLEWNPKEFTILGTEFNTTLENISDTNILSKFELMKFEINKWNNRNLTPYGKIVVIKSLIVSKIVHLLISLPKPSDRIIKNIQNLLYQFLWDGKPDKIKRTTVITPKSRGGLGMLDIESFIISLKTTWVRRLFNSDAKWKTVTLHLIPQLSYLDKLGTDFISEFIDKEKINPFWKEVLTSYVHYNKSCVIRDKQTFSMTPFMKNENITIDKKSFINKDFLDKGIYNISQLYSADGYLKYNDFKTKYDINISFLEYHSIICAIKLYEKKISPSFTDTNTAVKYSSRDPWTILLKSTKGSRDMYEVITAREGKTQNMPGGIEKWMRTEMGEFDWRKTFNILYNTTKDTKLLWFQYRVLNNRLTTNRSVSKFNPEQSDRCTFCNNHSEYISHLLYACPFTKAFWDEIQNKLNDRCQHINNLTFTKKLIILGYENNTTTDRVLELIILMGKYHIYRCKVKNVYPSYVHFLRELNLMSKTIFSVQPSHSKHRADIVKSEWMPYANLFKGLA